MLPSFFCPVNNPVHEYTLVFVFPSFDTALNEEHRAAVLRCPDLHLVDPHNIGSFGNIPAVVLLLPQRPSSTVPDQLPCLMLEKSTAIIISFLPFAGP